MTFYNKLSNVTKIKENQKKCHERFENFAAITLSSCKKLQVNSKQQIVCLKSSEKRGK